MSDEELAKQLRPAVEAIELLMDDKMAPLKVEIEALQQRLADYERRIETLEAASR